MGARRGARTHRANSYNGCVNAASQNLRSSTASSWPLRPCSACGLIQHVPVSRTPEVPAGMRVCCARCHATMLARPRLLRSNSRAAALAATALLLYPFAITMPMLEVAKFGHAREASILDGIATLLAGGHLLIGAIVLICSVILPAGKLLAVLVLASAGGRLATHHRATTYRLLEWTGRWGMLDVVLVAVLVAAVKLGELAEVTPGPAAWTFTACVALNLLAAACFDPHRLWEPKPA